MERGPTARRTTSPCAPSLRRRVGRNGPTPEEREAYKHDLPHARRTVSGLRRFAPRPSRQRELVCAGVLGVAVFQTAEEGPVLQRHRIRGAGEALDWTRPQPPKEMKIVESPGLPPELALPQPVNSRPFQRIGLFSCSLRVATGVCPGWKSGTPNCHKRKATSSACSSSRCVLVEPMPCPAS